MCSSRGNRVEAFKNQKSLCKSQRCDHSSVMSSSTTTNAVGSSPVQRFSSCSGRLAASSPRPPECLGAPARTALRWCHSGGPALAFCCGSPPRLSPPRLVAWGVWWPFRLAGQRERGQWTRGRKKEKENDTHKMIFEGKKDFPHVTITCFTF